MGHFLWTSNILARTTTFCAPSEGQKFIKREPRRKKGEAFLAFWVGWLVFIGIIIAPKNKALLRMKRRKHINATIHILFLGIIVCCLWGNSFYQTVTPWLQKTKRSFSYVHVSSPPKSVCMMIQIFYVLHHKRRWNLAVVILEVWSDRPLSVLHN